MLTSLSTIVAKSLAAFWVQETALTNALITLNKQRTTTSKQLTFSWSLNEVKKNLINKSDHGSSSSLSKIPIHLPLVRSKLHNNAKWNSSSKSQRQCLNKEYQYNIRPYIIYMAKPW